MASDKREYTGLLGDAKNLKASKILKFLSSSLKPRYLMVSNHSKANLCANVNMTTQAKLFVTRCIMFLRDSLNTME